MKHWRDLAELLDLYSVDYKRGGGADFYDLVISARLVRSRGFTVRDVAAAFRRVKKWSPVVYASRMKRALWQLFEASPEEWQELQLVPAATIFDLGEHIIDALPPLGETEAQDVEELVTILRDLGISPRDAATHGKHEAYKSARFRAE